MASPNTRHLVDPELLPMLDAMPTSRLTTALLPTLRENMRQPFPFTYGRETRPVTLELLTVPGPAGAPKVELRLYRPKDASGPAGVILHIHGGGYVCGSAAALEPIHRPLVAELGCALISVDYRLAPETRFPGAVEDCYAVLEWLFANAPRLGIDAARIGVMGESAGGGLAAALALLARDRGQYPLAFQHLVYPMIDDRTCVAKNPNQLTGEFIWTRHNNHFGWRALLGRPPGSSGVSKYAAPARAHDLARLPPTFLSTAALDLFLDENLAYARRLIRAGVPVELHVYPGAFHGFDLNPDTTVGRAARRDGLDALRRALNR